MLSRPHTAAEIAQARSIVTHFDAVTRDHDAVEAAELLVTAWDILRADRAARIAAQWHIHQQPKDAA